MTKEICQRKHKKEELEWRWRCKAAVEEAGCEGRPKQLIHHSLCEIFQLNSWRGAEPAVDVGCFLDHWA